MAHCAGKICYDPITDRQHTPESVRLIAAGEPEYCSGKANAIAAGMAAARHNRLVWTDDDFHHPPDWLATLNADYEKHGPVSKVPYFVGRDPLSVLLEPLYASAGSLSIYRDNRIWGGAVIFERGDIDEAAFIENLQRTVNDDGLLMEYLQVTTVGRTRIVPIGGTIRETVERQVRWTQILRWHVPCHYRDSSRLAVRPRRYNCGPTPDGSPPHSVAPRC